MVPHSCFHNETAPCQPRPRVPRRGGAHQLEGTRGIVFRCCSKGAPSPRLGQRRPKTDGTTEGEWRESGGENGCWGQVERSIVEGERREIWQLSHLWGKWKTAEDASGTRPFLQTLSRNSDASGTRPRPFLPAEGSWTGDRPHHRRARLVETVFPPHKRTAETVNTPPPHHHPHQCARPAHRRPEGRLRPTRWTRPSRLGRLPRPAGPAQRDARPQFAK
eukprot:gene24490-biopygen5928